MMLSMQTNISAMYASRHLQDNGKSMAKAIEKLSSGYRINTAADAPADLIISEQLRSQIEGLERAIRNTNETKNLLSITEGALGEVQNILRDMKKLAISSANSGVTNSDQTAANQAEMDSALQAIERILGTTSYAGRKLLDNLNVGGAPAASSMPSASSPASDSAGGAAAPSSPEPSGTTALKTDGSRLLLAAGKNTVPQVDEDGNITGGDKTFLLTGKDAGALASFAFADGTSLDDAIAALKGFALPDEEKVDLPADYAPPSARFGADINTIALDPLTLTHIQSLSDDDAAAFVSSFMTDFAKGSPFTGSISELELGPGVLELNPANPLKNMTKSEKQLYDLSQGLQNMGSGSIGGVEVTKAFGQDGLTQTRTLYLGDLYGGGAASLKNDPVAAMKIIDQAIKDIAGQRAAIGAVQANELQAMENVMSTELENLAKSESFIRDTDFASEMIEYTRTQIFSQVGTQMLSAANKQGEHILDLLM